MTTLANRLADHLVSRALPELLVVSGVIVLALASTVFLASIGA